MRIVPKIILVLYVMLLISFSVQAIGISPGVIKLDYKAGEEIDLNLFVLNKGSEDTSITLYVKQDDSLASSITLPSDTLLYVPAEGRKEFTIKVRFPDSAIPGSHHIYLGALENKGSAGMISTRTAIESLVIIEVPYPGKYLEAELYAPPSNTEQPVDATLKVIHKGSDPILSLVSSISLQDTSSIVGTVNAAPELNINPGEERIISYSIPTTAPTGDYTLTSFLDYDGNLLNISIPVKRGVFSVQILEFTSKFQLGKINRFNIKVENQWNQKIEKINAEIHVFNNQGETIARLTTPESSVNPFGSTTLETFWDIDALLPEGQYTTDITIHYDGNTQTKRVALFVEKEPGKKKVALPMILIIILAIAVIITLINIIILIKKKV